MSQAIRRALYRAKGLPDPGPTPSVEMRELVVLMPKRTGTAIDELDALLVPKQFPSRNDLVVELIEEGLRVAATAALEAARSMEQAAKDAKTPDIETGQEQGREVEVTNPNLSTEERQEMSARLRALRGQG